eukprot:COSAG03_NODE_1018_length_5011_cov_2.960505_6_plen_45_part_00
MRELFTGHCPGRPVKIHDHVTAAGGNPRLRQLSLRARSEDLRTD